MQKRKIVTGRNRESPFPSLSRRGEWLEDEDECIKTPYINSIWGRRNVLREGLLGAHLGTRARRPESRTTHLSVASPNQSEGGIAIRLPYVTILVRKALSRSF